MPSGCVGQFNGADCRERRHRRHPPGVVPDTIVRRGVQPAALPSAATITVRRSKRSSRGCGGASGRFSQRSTRRAACAKQLSDYRLHPAVLDACFPDLVADLWTRVCRA